MEVEKKDNSKVDIQNSQYKLLSEDNKDDIYNLQISIKSELIFLNYHYIIHQKKLKNILMKYKIENYINFKKKKKIL